MRKERRFPLIIAALVVAACPVLDSSALADKELAALMQRNRDHFTEIVQSAYFVSLDRPLEPHEFERLRAQAQAISDIGRQVRANHSQGSQFDEIADDLREHAEGAAKAAAEEDLPELNTEIGEMAEYCAKCHNAFRW